MGYITALLVSPTVCGVKNEGKVVPVHSTKASVLV